MKQMIINLLIEGCEEDLHTIKGNIFREASEAMVNCHTTMIDVDTPVTTPKGCIEIPKFLSGRGGNK